MVVPFYVLSGKKSKGDHRDMQTRILLENGHRPTIVRFRDSRGSSAEYDERHDIARSDHLHWMAFWTVERAIGPVLLWLTGQVG